MPFLSLFGLILLVLTSTAELIEQHSIVDIHHVSTEFQLTTLAVATDSSPSSSSISPASAPPSASLVRTASATSECISKSQPVEYSHCRSTSPSYSQQSTGDVESEHSLASACATVIPCPSHSHHDRHEPMAANAASLPFVTQPDLSPSQRTRRGRIAPYGGATDRLD